MIKWPWQSSMMLNHPWVMQLFLITMAILGSAITWIRSKNRDE